MNEENNIYVALTFTLIYLYILFIFFIVLVLLYVNFLIKKEPEEQRNCLYISLFMILPICGIIFQMVIYGISLIWPFTALSILMVYLNIQQRQLTAQKLHSAEQETEILQSHISIILSQIQPNFLYNALTAIAQLCDLNPKVAKKMTIDFSDYLYGNMDSLKLRKPISFEQELQHTKFIYLSKNNDLENF